jgi:hypothetical protein
MPAYKLKLFKEIFLPLYRLKSCPDKEVVEGSDNFGRQENRIALTTKQLCDYLKENEGKIVTTNNLKKTYLNELLNNGYIDEEDSIIDKRQKIYYPLIEFPPHNEEQKIRNYTTLDGVDNFLQNTKLLLPKNCINIPQNWLRFEIFDLLKYPLKLDKFVLLHEDENAVYLQV